MKLTIFIPCFNENATILKAIEEARSINVEKEIIVTDNCSTDGTKQILDGLRQDKDLKIIFHPRNLGVGFSGAEAMHLAKGDYFFSPGADLEYKMSDVYKMLDKMESEDLDLVLGSRLLAKKDVSVWGLMRERPFWLGTIISTFLINLLYRKNFTDIIGIHLIKTNVLKSLKFRSSSHDVAFEIISKICKRGCRIGEVAVSYSPRTSKEGKTIKPIDMIPALLTIFRVKLFG
jgi:glycosyltransferase involved in cell wall biosynthesis